MELFKLLFTIDLFCVVVNFVACIILMYFCDRELNARDAVYAIGITILGPLGTIFISIACVINAINIYKEKTAKKLFNNDGGSI